MTKIVFAEPDGRRTEIDAKDGVSLMHTAIAHNISGIVGECGGAAMCATCHCYVDPAFADKLPPRSDIEDEMLEAAAAPRTQFSRLSCQVKVAPALEGMVVTVPDTQF